jgi:hypothetical protein
VAYLDQSNLSYDTEFNQRLVAALNSESAVKPADPVADAVLRGQGQQLFMPLVSAAPGFADTYAAGGSAAIQDGELLAAVQAAWPRVAALLGAGS